MESPNLNSLPAPLNEDEFELFRRGVSDDPATDVWVNAAGDFAFLNPHPSVDYSAYKPRVSNHSLSQYKTGLIQSLYRRRTEKLRPWLNEAGAILEVGGGDGAYLEYLRGVLVPHAAFSMVEPDRNTLEIRRAKAWLDDYVELAEVEAVGARFDIVMMFHVFEHISQPHRFLADVARCLRPGGQMIIEVPCLHDPLLDLFSCEAYSAFYFQGQHPFVYSMASLERVLRVGGFVVTGMVPFQRYGLENHLTWLASGRPGGDRELAHLLAETEDAYIAALEARGRTDTIIAVTQPKEVLSA